MRFRSCWDYRKRAVSISVKIPQENSSAGIVMCLNWYVKVGSSEIEVCFGNKMLEKVYNNLL